LAAEGTFANTGRHGPRRSHIVTRIGAWFGVSVESVDLVIPALVCPGASNRFSPDIVRGGLAGRRSFIPRPLIMASGPVVLEHYFGLTGSIERKQQQEDQG
jgi:hypothetical protein